jgi:hypothetical protein
MNWIDALNRVLGSVFGTALGLAGAACLLVATGAVDTGTLALSEWFREQFQYLAALNGDGETTAVLASAAAVGFGLLLVLVEMAPRGRRANRTLNMIDANGNSVVTSAESVKLIVEQTALEVPGVLHASAAVRQSASGVRVEAAALLQPDVNDVEKSNELNDRIRTEIQNRLAMKMAGLRLNLTLARKADLKPSRRWGPSRFGERREEISND